jgi:hypothetical protein
MIVIEQAAEREFTRQQWATFIIVWSSTTIKKTWDKFHCNFKEGIRVHPLGYIGVHLG